MSLDNHPPDYATFELLIGERMTKGYPLTITQSPAGEVTSRCRLELTDGELQDALTAVADRNVDAAFLTQLGAFLFEELFPDVIGELYRTSLGMARGQRQRLCVRLRIEPPELACLPWELLFDTREEQHLAIASEIVLARYVPMRLPVRPTVVTLPLRLLVVLASPHDLPGLNVAEERRLIEEALRERVTQQQMDVQFLEMATMANIQQALRIFQPQLFHFVGHGLFDGTCAQLVLEDGQKNAAPVDERTFCELLNGSRETRLAVLNACQSGNTSSSEPLVGLAPRLLQRQLSAVVAMQYPITDQAGLLFAREFYRSLAAGLPIDAAVDEARRGIWLELGADHPDWAAPVLFLRAMDGRLFQVKQPQPVTVMIPKPPQPIPPPPVATFVGRAQELAYFTQKLTTEHYVVITGMPGMGKTALAAALARQSAPAEKIFWHSFHEDEDTSTVVWKLAGFLAWHGQEEIWRQLEGARQSGHQAPQFDLLLDYLGQQLIHQEYILCFDDCQFVAKDPPLVHFLERSLPRLATSSLRLIFTSREVPSFLPVTDPDVLDGLTLADTDAFVAQQWPGQDLQIVAHLHTNTGGNVQLLMLAVNALQRTSHPAQLLARLAEADNIERYLLREVDDGLTVAERELMGALAILLGHPVPRRTIEMVLGAGNLRRTLRALRDRHLVVVSGDEPDQHFSQHAIVRAFYYDLLAPETRRQMHRRAAESNLSMASYLEAAHHWCRGDQPQTAVKLLVEQFHAIVNAGQSRALYELQAQIRASEVDEIAWARLKIVAGRAAMLAIDIPTALTEFDLALQSSDLYTRALAYYYRAKTTEHVNHIASVADFRRGIDLAEALPKEAKTAELLVDLSIGIAWLYLQQIVEPDTAEKYLSHAQEIVGVTDFRRQSDLQNAWAGLWAIRKQPEKRLHHAHAAWAMAAETHESELMIKTGHNLGRAYFTVDQLETGFAYLEQARVQADAIGNEQWVGKCHQALGAGYFLAKQYAEAINEHELAYAAYAKTGNEQWLGWVCYDLAGLYCTVGKPAQANPYFQQAMALSRQANLQRLHDALTRLAAETPALIAYTSESE